MINILTDITNQSCVEWDSNIPTFNLELTGSSTDLSYLDATFQWYYNSSSIDGTGNYITSSGQGSSSLTLITNLTSSAGRFWCVYVSESVGGTSSVATLSVGSVIKTQPAFGVLSVNDWSSINLVVVLTGSGATGATYQWQRPSGTNITNATASLLSTQLIASNYNQYRVLIQSASLGKTSSLVAYTGLINPLVNVQPSASVPTGIPFEPLSIGGAVFSSSIPLTYSWFRNGTIVSGETNNSINTTFLFTDPFNLSFYEVATTDSGSTQSSTVSSIANRGGACAEQPFQYRTDLTDGFTGRGSGYVRV
jgi:hypothetical protein